ncbi:hypothetical protein C8J56DRAFT_1056171 [Mycena floridula]|nr:hypothetical protein C8J56DRAFT_1056171 [Mycena floridula]
MSESIVSPHNVGSFGLHGASCGKESSLDVPAKRGEGFSSRKISPPSDDGGVFDSNAPYKADPFPKPPTNPKVVPKSKPKPAAAPKAPMSLLDKITTLGPDRKTTAHQLVTSIHPPDLKSTGCVLNAIRQITLLADKKKGLGPEATRVIADLAEWGMMWAKKEGESKKDEETTGLPQKETPLGERMGQLQKKLDEVLKGLSNQQQPPPVPHVHDNCRSQLPPHSKPAIPSSSSSPSPRHSVSVSLMKCTKASKLRNMPNQELTAKIQSTVRGCNSESLNSVTVQAVSFKGRDHLKIFVKTEDEAQSFLRFSENWLAALAPGVTLITKVFKIVIHSVSSYHKPKSESSRAEIIDKNPELTEGNFIDDCWLNEKAISSGKKASSLVISVASEAAANHILEHGIIIEQAICYGEWYQSGPEQCYRCQEWDGHRSYQCPRKTAICARCAGPHQTGACPCPHNGKCKSVRDCPVTPKCTLCESVQIGSGNHFAFDKSCPIHQKAFEEARLGSSSSHVSLHYSS